MADHPVAAHVTPLPAVNALTFLASIGTGMMWAGIGFIAKHEYGYSSRRTLLLYLLMGVMYAAAALHAGSVLRMVQQRASPRAVLAIILLLMAGLCAGPALARADWVLWIVALAVNVLAAWLWPIVESYLAAGRHGAPMRRAIGWWNIAWTSAVALSLLGLAPLIERHARVSFAAVAAVSVAALAALRWFPSRPGAHDEASWQASIGPEYPQLLHAARMLLPLSYVLNSALMPLVPYLLERAGVAGFWGPPAASTWAIVRVAAMAGMWGLAFWHGRWGTLLVGGVGMTLGFAMVVMGASLGGLTVILAGLALFGAGIGVIYFAAIYYAMSVGRAAVEAGGTHEALIGAGYAAGPLAGFIGLWIQDAARERGTVVWEGAGVVAVACLLTIVAAAGAGRSYLRARQLRAQSAAAPHEMRI